MTLLLCDVGGTHVRFATGDINGGNCTSKPQKLRVDRSASLEDAIAVFLATEKIDPAAVDAFYLSFSNRNAWLTHPERIKTILPNARVRQVNDFAANAYGIITADSGDLEALNTVQSMVDASLSKAVIGVGTGLGLAYICENSFVQRTHGGHMLPAVNPHQKIFDFIAAKKSHVSIYEDILSGQGLYETYVYLSKDEAKYHSAEDLMRDGRDDPIFHRALTVFFEMLGIFAHQAVAFGHAYGGIYLTGGVIDKLMAANLFDADALLETFIQDNVPVVKRDVEATPVYWIRDEFVSLKGLCYLAKKDQADA